MALTLDNNAGTISFDGYLIQGPGRINLSATTDPSVSDDNTQGYRVGSYWINTTLSRVWWCTDATTGAAQWANAVGAGAPSNAQYVVLANNATLSQERVLTGTANQITLTDAGAESTITVAIAANPILSGTGSLTIPTGTTAQRPTPTAAMVRYNTTDNTLEYYSTTWETLASRSWSTAEFQEQNGYTQSLYATTGSGFFSTNGTTGNLRTFSASGGISISNGDGTSGNPTISSTGELAALNGISGTGIAARTASATWATRTLTAPAAGFTITNPGGVAGNPTFTLSDDLAALEALSSQGFAVRTTTNTWAVRTIQAGTGTQLTVLYGDGVSNNPLIYIADNPVIPGTEKIRIPAGNTAGRPAAPATSDFRYNTTTSLLEWYGPSSYSPYTVGWNSALEYNAALYGMGSAFSSATGIMVSVGSGVFAGRTIQTSTAGISVSNGNGVAGNPNIAVTDDLLAIENLSSTGLAARTGTSTWAVRTLTGPAAGISVTNGNGVSGNPTLALTDDLAGVEGLSTNGIAVRTGTSTWNTRTITGTANQISIADGGGTAGNPTISIADNPIFPGTGSLTLPTGTTAQRSSPGVNGMVRYNSTLGVIESYVASSWYTMLTEANFRLYEEYFSSGIDPVVGTIANSVAIGSGAKTETAGEIAIGSGAFSSAGDAGASFLVLRQSTTDATPTEVICNTSSNITLTAEYMYLFDCDIVARHTTSDVNACWNLKFGIQRGSSASTTRIVGTPILTTYGVDNDAIAWDVQVSADTTNGRPKIEVVGQAATTIRWTVNARITKVNG